MGKIWIYSDILKESKQWNRDTPLPDGWKIGRVVDWDLYDEKQKLKNISKKKNEEQNLKQNLIYTEMYEIYSKFGWKYMVEKYQYKYSLSNFAKICKKRVKGFVSQKGKKRGK